MRLERELQILAQLPQSEDFSQFKKDINPDWIEEALHATGTATIRKRRLPAIHVVWLVIGMALFRNRSIVETVNTLGLALSTPRQKPIARSVVSAARTRLGDEPMEWLFSRCADAWAHQRARTENAWRGLSLYAIDGTLLTAADTKENRNHFGVHKAKNGNAPFPQVRLVALMAVRSHLMANVVFGSQGNGERTYAEQLVSSIPDYSLTIFDRLYYDANVFIPLSTQGTERYFLLRLKKSFQGGRLIRRLGRHDRLVEIDISWDARVKNPELPKTAIVRVIQYQRKGFRPQHLMTSLIDAEKYPAKEIIEVYHERWEIELGYREVKTEMLEGSLLRSTEPKRVCQEIWGLLIAYNLIRLEMQRVAKAANVSPLRISFVAACHLIYNEWLWCAFALPGAIPRHLLELEQQLSLFILPPRRARWYPRKVKSPYGRYPRKSPREKGKRLIPV